MLDLGFKVEIDIQKIRIPIWFDGVNMCPCCGAKELIFINAFGKEEAKEIKPFDHIKCKKCGHNFSIKWQSDMNGAMYPSAVQKNIARDFNNFVNTGNIKDNGCKEFLE